MGTGMDHRPPVALIIEAESFGQVVAARARCPRPPRAVRPSGSALRADPTAGTNREAGDDLAWHLPAPRDDDPSVLVGSSSSRARRSVVVSPEMQAYAWTFYIDSSPSWIADFSRNSDWVHSSFPAEVSALSRNGSQLLQGSGEIGSEVLEVLDPDAEPDEPVIDAACRPDLGGDAGVGHGRGVADQRFHAAQALGQAEQARPGKEAARPIPRLPVTGR